MGTEFGLWRVSDAPLRMQPTMLPLESQLEEFIEADSTLLGTQLLLIGRQVPTAHGKFIDLLGVDSDGTIHVLELKRDRTPRDVVAQVLDYGSWVTQLDGDAIREIFESYDTDRDLDTAFGETFGVSVPDDLNAAQVLTIIASSADASTERIVAYLNTGYAVPINVAFFQYFEDHGSKYLARTWLVDESQLEETPSVRKRSGAASWNGRDWYVSFGEDSGSRTWDDAQKYNFVSAGGGSWYSRTLRNLPVGARVFVNVPGKGYVGVGNVTGPAKRASTAVVQVNGEPRKFAELDLVGSYRHRGDDEADDPAEFVVPVEWLRKRPSAQAFWKPGMFGNQNSACRLRNQFTIDEVTREFKLGSED